MEPINIPGRPELATNMTI